MIVSWPRNDCGWQIIQFRAIAGKIYSSCSFVTRLPRSYSFVKKLLVRQKVTRLQISYSFVKKLLKIQNDDTNVAEQSLTRPNHEKFTSFHIFMHALCFTWQYYIRNFRKKFITSCKINNARHTICCFWKHHVVFLLLGSLRM